MDWTPASPTTGLGDMMDRISFLNFQKGVAIALILTGHFLQFYVFNGSGAIWEDPVYKSLYIFGFQYYYAMNGFSLSKNLDQFKFIDVLKWKFTQYAAPLCFWAGLGTLFLVALHSQEAGRFGIPDPHAIFLYVSGYWILFSDIFCTLLIALILKLPGPAKIKIPLSILLVFLIPNGGRIAMLSMVRYAYMGFAIGYVIGMFKIDWTPRLWMVLAMIPVCAVLHTLWTIDTYIYMNRMNYFGAETRGNTWLMVAGTASFMFVAYATIRWLYGKLRTNKPLSDYIFMLASLNSQIILFEVFFYLIVDRMHFWQTHIWLVDFAIAAVVNFTVMALVPLTFRVIKPGSLLFRLIWGTTAPLGADPKNEVYPAPQLKAA